MLAEPWPPQTSDYATMLPSEWSTLVHRGDTDGLRIPGYPRFCRLAKKLIWVFCTILRKKSNECFGQQNIFHLGSRSVDHSWNSDMEAAIVTEIPGKILIPKRSGFLYMGDGLQRDQASYEELGVEDIKTYRIAKHPGPGGNPQNGPCTSFREEKLTFTKASTVQLGIFKDSVWRLGISLVIQIKNGQVHSSHKAMASHGLPWWLRG